MEVLEIRLLNGLTPNWIEGPETTSPQDTEPLGENLWGFISWDAIKETFGTVQNLYAVIQNIHREIRALKEKFRQFGVDFQGLALQPNLEGGTGNSYFLVDEQGKRKFVVKPLDEDTGAINSTSHTSLSSYSPLRKNVPLYRGPMREVLAYRIAQIMGLESVAPKTVFSVIQSERFHDLSEHVSPQELPRYWEQCGKPDQEKLCSVQEYVEKSQPLPEARQNLLQAGLSEEEIADRFDPEDFENVHLLLWITYDTDGHPGNFLVYPKGIDTLGNEILGLKKIDNGLAFPDSNTQLWNMLSIMPNANQPLSDRARAKIATINIDQLAAEFKKFGLESAIPALRQRIPFLQELAKHPMTLKEINQALRKMNTLKVGRKR